MECQMKHLVAQCSLPQRIAADIPPRAATTALVQLSRTDGVATPAHGSDSSSEESDGMEQEGAGWQAAPTKRSPKRQIEAVAALHSSFPAGLGGGLSRIGKKSAKKAGKAASLSEPR